MAATFDPALPTRKDYLRLALGDMDVSTALVADETIAALLTALGFAGALAHLAESLALQYAQRPSQVGERDGLTQQWADRVSAWRELADKARAGLIADPLSSPAGRGIDIRQTDVQQATPGRPLPTYLPPGVMGGFRSE